MIKRVVLGDGLLGSELVRQTGWGCISRREQGIDFTKPHTYEHLIVGYDEVINCIAHTDTYDENRDIHWDVNYAGVSKLVDICNKHDIPLITCILIPKRTLRKQIYPPRVILGMVILNCLGMPISSLSRTTT